MNLFRITKPKYAYNLSGTGAKLAGGRWNPGGKAVVYTAGSSVLALLEHLTHMSRADLELTFQFILIETYKTPISFLEDHFPSLPSGWKDDLIICRKYGKQWIEAQLSLILRVPSVHSPWEYNFLINPQHPALDIKIVDQEYYVYDDRFLSEG